MTYIRTRKGKFALAAVVLAMLALTTVSFAGRRADTVCQASCSDTYKTGYRACRLSADVDGCRATVYSIWLACYTNSVNSDPNTTACVP